MGEVEGIVVVVLDVFEVAIVDGIVACVVVLIVVEVVAEVVQETRIRGIIMRTVSVIQIAPFFIVSSLYSLENIWRIY